MFCILKDAACVDGNCVPSGRVTVIGLLSGTSSLNVFGGATFVVAAVSAIAHVFGVMVWACECILHIT